MLSTAFILFKQNNIQSSMLNAKRTSSSTTSLLHPPRHLRHLEFPVLQRVLLHHTEKKRGNDEDMDCRRNKPANQGCCQGLHDVGSHSGAPHDRNETDEGSRNGHDLGSETKHRALNGRLVDITVR